MPAIPLLETVLASAKELIDDIPSWRSGKTYHGVKTTSKKSGGSGPAWSLNYKFTPPISNRTFTFLIASVLEDTESRQGYVISLPLDVSSDESLASKEPLGVRARYVSVERVRELDGQVEWIYTVSMATSSNPGGMIPIFLSDSQMPSKIAEILRLTGCPARARLAEK
ncbi:hypothetical protein FRC09_016962 [Ceratobasidium sp. 395]|nr:hypothetical protein FRC09_016962 [Ceratobasidium sp. 395]